MDAFPVDLQESRCESSERSSPPHPRRSFIATRYVWIHHTHIWRPPTDVFETEHFIRVQVEVAGMENSDFAVVMDGRILRVSGCRKDHSEHRVYHQMEIHTGEFMTEVEIPVPVESNIVRAQYHDGYLTVELRKLHSEQEGTA
jgi:HSP20 family protein